MGDAILEYHVVEGAAVYSKDLKPEQEFKTLEGREIIVHKDHEGHVYVNRGVRVVAADNGATNGVVHVVDNVLIPHQGRLGAAPTKNIVELAVADKDLSTLVAVLKAGKLVDALEGKGPFTVFAPTNEAFAKIPAEELKKLLDPANIKELDDILEYHVVEGAAVYSKDLKPEQEFKTLEGRPIRVIKDHEGNVFVNHGVRVIAA